MIKNVYLLLIGALLVGISACHKNNNGGGGSGNVTDTTTKVTNPTGKDLPSGVSQGVNFLNNGASVVFVIYAPGKKSFYLLGDFNNWSKTATPMNNTKDGNYWWVQVDNLNPATEYSYQYYIDGSITVGDPYAHKILDKNNDGDAGVQANYPGLKAFPAGATGNPIVSDFWYNAPKYTWKNASFTKPDAKNLVVYELLVRDFVATHSYQTLTDTLNYMKRLGVNAIELLPVNEFEGNNSWGYNPNYMMALDKYYGTENNYKTFIDACHSAGIAVIMDIVLEDLAGSSPMCQMYWDPNASNSDGGKGAPSAASPWLNQLRTHPYGVFNQLDYDKPPTVTFAENVFKYWIQEYHVDGFRLDQANGYTQTNSNANGSLWTAYDEDRVKTLTTLTSSVKSVDPTAYMILEEFAAASEVSKLADNGMISWNKQTDPATQAAMGYSAGPVWDLSSMFYDSFGITQPAALMTYAESHDEVRVQFKNGAYGNSSGSYNVKTLATGLQRDAMLATFLFAVPGPPKMFWMFGERGYDDASAGPDYGNLNGNGDKRTDPQPPDWQYMSDPNRAALFGIYAHLIHYKTHNTVFNTTSFSHSLSGAVKTINLNDPTANVVVVGNFDVVNQTANVTFPSTGTWYDNISGSTLNVTSTTMPLTFTPGEYHLYSNVKLQ